MSETISTDGVSMEAEKPVSSEDDVKFPPFPEVQDDDFDEDISEEERKYYIELYPDLNKIKTAKLHCTACDRHLGNSIRNEGRMRPHPMLRTLVCHTCYTFYNSGEFEKGDDGSELYCRWCGQGGQVYCCSDCPHVFCAKCIKRNLGLPKIKEIENTDDWKCFKCNPRCLWDLRALCWALLRYCDLKNKMLYQTQDPVLREMYIKNSAVDHSECCKNKTKRRERKRDSENSSNKLSPIAKLPPVIQVKKFASVNADETPQKEKKRPAKRSASPKYKPILIKNPVSLNPTVVQPVVKKFRGPNTAVLNPVRFNNDKLLTYPRIKPKPHAPMGIGNNFNGFNNANNTFGGMNNMILSINDTLNLSLDSLTQGLDMSAVAHLASAQKNDDVVCTPDLPLEPLCEVTEDHDDDVECITPGPSSTPRPVVKNPPPLIPRTGVSNPNDLSFDNIIQMTENDVTINEATGGLKFRVDPQTLSSNKMYRLPDGRIFAINVNPNMPGGYSATIVAVSDTNKAPPKVATYAAKLSAVPQTPSPVLTKKRQSQRPSSNKQNPTKLKNKVNQSSRDCDLNVPVEWFRYNLLDAIDCLEYSLIRLNRLKREATTMHLRTRTIDEMRGLHRNLERLLNTSSSRFVEIRHNINKEFKQYVTKKKLEEASHHSQEEDDDDDVEILPDENEGPIFIDENSLDSHPDNQEVDLTGAGSSEHNDSSENKDTNPINISNHDDEAPIRNSNAFDTSLTCEESYVTLKGDLEKGMNLEKETLDDGNSNDANVDKEKDKINVTDNSNCADSNRKDSVETNGDVEHFKNEQDDQLTDVDTSKDDDMSRDGDLPKEIDEVDSKKNVLKDTDDKQEDTENAQEPDISEEMIESLLKDDSMGANVETANSSNPNSMDVSEN
ncbi:hypothetical protein K1T71_005079 [Dendrolimus kikuchii]|uniref:Uncharacterized protein n=1 Tax=Dendrolimus kikuchii TaxID=765133 RepID=A0ACC1D749_9NEOP|nr:hypothetical protein K1T71_005079 [Dendrolimus kikuchii]